MSDSKDTGENPTPEFYLDRIFEKFEEQEARLEEVGKEAIANVDTLMTSLRTKGKDIFDNEKDVYIGLDAFKKVMRYTNHLVIDIDLRRRALSQPEKMAEQAMQQAELSGRQQTLPTAAALTNQSVAGEYGMWRYLGERKKMQALEKITAGAKEPQMTTTERQVDFMNYARDIPPELNKLYDWLGGTLLRINRFKCDKTKRICYSMLRTHLEKLTTLTIGFSGAVIEFRKELVGEREVAYAQAFIVLEQARIAASAMPLARGSPVSLDPAGLAMRDRVR
ncbi:hypothetical protein MUP01_10665 [Candidatus Bathyarchaeota archaeon]|nr:hypothetical protein [Candidatus Bathyarchaeota archaeon]